MASRVLAIYHRAETFGGSFNSVREVLSRVDRQRFAVTCGVPGSGNVERTFQALGLPVKHVRERAGAKSTTYAWALATVLRHIRDKKVDLLYVCDHVYWRSSALLAARLAGIASVVHLRSPRDDISRDTELLRASIIVGNSSATLGDLRNVMPAERLRVVPNFIDFAPFDQPRQIRDNLFAAPAPVVGFVGVFRPEKGIEYFLDMARLIRMRRPDVRFLAVGGESSVANVGWFDKMKSYATSLGLDPFIRFTGEQSNVADFLAAMDVVVVPSLNEGFGRVIVEANAVGRLVVGAAAAGIPEVIDAGVSGVLVPPRDSQSLADAVLRILDDVEWRARALQDLPAQTRQRFSPDVQMKKLQQAWEDAIASVE